MIKLCDKSSGMIIKKQSENYSRLISFVLLLIITPAFAAVMPDRIHDVYWFDSETFYVFGGSFESEEIDTLGRIVPRNPRT